ncbi:MAG: aminotransferase class V-fold PLP-dependent enzyme [Candidatus Aminicenantes bacterium]|nr:MAG: aminotransferase class V-fold PLP-dependent enzyme [Candidatus Aminicenantes bacterium]
MDQKIQPTFENRFKGLSRRDFVRYLLAGSALSVASLGKLNASVYQSITTLNQKYIEDESPDGVYWDAIGKHFLFKDRLIMMNNGTVGPMPKPVFNTLIKSFRIQVTNPFDVYNFIPRKKQEVRTKLASFINASPEEVVITRNTTEGMNFVANGLDLKEGDEVLLSTMEHPGGTHPWKLKAKRYGIKIKNVPIGLPPKSVDEIVDGFRKAITSRTKVISISHTVYISGLISPLKELSKMAHEKDVLVLADSAHGIGMLSLDMKALGVDFFATSPYKWLGASTGVGLLYVKKGVQDKLWPTIATGGWDSYKDSRKFETLGQRADALTIALGEAVDFQNAIGKERIERRVKTLAGYLKRELSKIPGVVLHTSQDAYLSGGLTAFHVEGVESQNIVNYLREKYNIVVRTIGNKREGTHGVRVSTHIYVSLKHVDMLIEGIKHLVKHRS